MALEIGTEMACYDAAAIDGGWKKTPKCGFLIQGAGGKLYCSYYYNEARNQMLDQLGPILFDDIGLDEGPRSEVWKGNLVRECTIKECPSFSRKLMNRLRSEPSIEK